MDTNDLVSHASAVCFPSYATKDVSFLLHRVLNGVLGRKDRMIWDKMLIMPWCYLFSSIGLVIITASCGFPPLGSKFTFSLGKRMETILHLAAWGKLGVRNILTHSTQSGNGTSSPKMMSLPVVSRSSCYHSAFWKKNSFFFFYKEKGEESV